MQADGSEKNNPMFHIWNNALSKYWCGCSNVASSMQLEWALQGDEALICAECLSAAKESLGSAKAANAE
jgi:hypothetical protein